MSHHRVLVPLQMRFARRWFPPSAHPRCKVPLQPEPVADFLQGARAVAIPFAAVSPVIPKATRAPRINYVDDEAATIPMRGLDVARAQAILDRVALRKPDTLMPVEAAPEASEADRTARVRIHGRRALVAVLVAAVAILIVSALRAQPMSTHVLGAERQAARRDVGVLVVAGEKDVVVFVDGARAGVAPDPIEVSCGVHKVRIGDHGSTREVDVPCEGRLEL